MTEPPKKRLPRDADGKFPQGTSGNPKGRPKKKAPRITHPEAFRDAASEVAEHKVKVTIEGESLTLTLLQANVMTLAMKGAHGHAISARHFLSHHRMLQEQELRQMREMTEHMKSANSRWELEENPEKRALMKATFEYSSRIATGLRDRWPI